MLLAAILLPLAFMAGPVPTRTCAERVEGGTGELVRHTSDLATRNVVIHGIRRYTRVRIRATRLGDFTAKAGISVRAGAPVLLRIARRDRGSVALDYDMSRWRSRHPRTVANGAGTARVRIEPCARSQPRFSGPGTVGEWTGFNGGFVVARRACVTVTIERAGEAPLRRRIGFGRRCGTSGR